MKPNELKNIVEPISLADERRRRSNERIDRRRAINMLERAVLQMDLYSEFKEMSELARMSRGVLERLVKQGSK